MPSHLKFIVLELEGFGDSLAVASRHLKDKPHIWHVQPRTPVTHASPRNNRNVIKIDSTIKATNAVPEHCIMQEPSQYWHTESEFAIQDNLS